MQKNNSERWFERNPAITLTIIVVIALLLLDLLFGAILIPTDYNAFRIPHPVFHHGLLPMQKTKNKWGNRVFDVYTNSLGFKDGSARKVEKKIKNKRIVFIGDSFTEGVGMTWEESFTGILDKKLKDSEVLNAGVVSYSPKLYYLKINYLINHDSLAFNDLYVLIDNSDPLNEITYVEFKPYPDQKMKIISHRIKKALFEHSYIYHTISQILMKQSRSEITESWNPMSGQSVVDDIASEEDAFIAATPLWSFTPELYKKWGKTGLELAAENMQKLADLCHQNKIQLHIVIYPWPMQIKKALLNDVQVKFWEQFCNEYHLDFINLYPYFIGREDQIKTLQTYYINGDVHWNQEGNKKVAEILYNHIMQEKQQNK